MCCVSKVFNYKYLHNNLAWHFTSASLNHSKLYNVMHGNCLLATAEKHQNPFTTDSTARPRFPTCLDIFNIYQCINQGTPSTATSGHLRSPKNSSSRQRPSWKVAYFEATAVPEVCAMKCNVIQVLWTQKTRKAGYIHMIITLEMA